MYALMQCRLPDVSGHCIQQLSGVGAPVQSSIAYVQVTVAVTVLSQSLSSPPVDYRLKSSSCVLQFTNASSTLPLRCT